MPIDARRCPRCGMKICICNQQDDDKKNGK